MSSSLSNWKRGQRHDKHVYENRTEVWPEAQSKQALQKFGKSVDDLDGRVLEVGSGLGIIHSLQPDAQTIGIDPLSLHNKQHLQSSHADVTAGAGEHLPFNTSSIDTVLSYNVLDHCIDPAAVVEEMARVTKPGGELLLEVNTYEVPALGRESIIGRLDDEHPHHFSSAEVQSLIADAGFRVTRTKTLTRFELLKDATIRRVGALLFRIRRLFLTAVKA